MHQHPRFVRSFAVGASLLATVAFPLVAAAKLSKTGSSSTVFNVSGQAGLTIAGTTSDMTIVDDGNSDMTIVDDGNKVTITVPLANIDTGIPLRNQHTKDALEVSKCPNAILQVARSALKFPAAGSASSGDAAGQLTIHCQTKPVTFHYSAKVAGAVYTITGTTSINMTDYGVNPPSYLGVTVKPAVGINTSFQAQSG